MDTDDGDLTRAQLWALELYQRILSRITKRQRELPEEETALRRRTEEAGKRLSALEGELKAKQLEQKRLEMEVDGVKGRRARHQHQLLSAKDNREYQTLLEEIEREKRKQAELEDQILELMEDLEELSPAVARTRGESKNETSEVEASLAALAAEGEELEERRAILERERGALVEQLSTVGRRIFDKLTSQQHICAMVDNGICASCRMEVPTQTISEVRAGELRSCESCSAVLFTDEQTSLARTLARNHGFLPAGNEG